MAGGARGARSAAARFGREVGVERHLWADRAVATHAGAANFLRDIEEPITNPAQLAAALVTVVLAKPSVLRASRAGSVGRVRRGAGGAKAGRRDAARVYCRLRGGHRLGRHDRPHLDK